jgi:hypothetical protein
MSATILEGLNGSLKVSNTVKTVEIFTFKILDGVLAQTEREEISARSSTVNTYTAKTTDLKTVENHPLIPIHGRFRNDPTWDRFMQNIEEYNQEVDAAERSRE